MVRRRWSSVFVALLGALTLPIAFGAALGASPASAASSWSVVQSPAVPFGELIAVGGSSANDVWSVGSWFNASTGAYLSLALHWNGTGWKRVFTPGEGGWNQFRAVAVLSPTNAWAVGYGKSYTTLLEHWNGSSWSKVESPVGGPGDSELNGATALADGTAWAIGSWEPNGDGTDQPLTIVLPAG